MIRPLYTDRDLSLEAMHTALDLTNYPYADFHRAYMDRSMILSFLDGEDFVGVMWFYGKGDDGLDLVMHAAILDEYRGRFFTRKLVDHISTVLWCLGFESVSVETDYKDMALRMGAKLDDDGCAVFALPHKWR